MGNAHPCCHGRALLAACNEGNTQEASQLLERHPSASCYSTCVERNSPLLVASGRGHYRLVQAIVEAAVMAHGPARAKRALNHTNSKGHSALILACMNGHAQCVEVLVCNGASPLALDNSRHNTALHWAASCCRSDCVQRLLGSSATFQMQSGEVVAISDIPCFDEDNETLVKFVDRHNGWGLTALHLAAFKGSTSTVRALLRNGAAIGSVTVAPSIGACPVSQPTGSTALHLAAAAEDLSMVRLLLEAQAVQNSPDLRRAMNSQGQRPLDLAHSVGNLLLLHMLDPSHPLSAVTAPHQGLMLYPGGVVPMPVHTPLGDVGLAQGLSALGALGGPLSNGASWVLGSRGSLAGLGFRGTGRRGGSSRGDQPPHVALGSMLQRLRLVLSLEVVDVQNKLAAATAAAAAAAAAGSSSGTDGGAHGMSCLLQLGDQQQKLRQKQKQQQQQQHNSHRRQQQQLEQQGSLRRVESDSPLTGGYVSGDCDGSTDGDTIPAAADIAAADSSAAATDTTSEDDSDSSSIADDCRPKRSRQQQQQLLLHKQALLQAARQQQQQQRRAAAECAALESRLETVQGLLSIIQEMLAALPSGAIGAVSSAANGGGSAALPGAAAGAAAAAAIEQQVGSSGSSRRRRNGGSTSSSSRGGRRSGWGWGLLDRVIGAAALTAAEQVSGSGGSSAAGLLNPLQAGLGGPQDSGTQQGLAGPSSAGLAAAEQAAAEQVFTAFITPGTLNSLAAVTKLLVNASSLSGKQQGSGGGGAAAAGAAYSGPDSLTRPDSWPAGPPTGAAGSSSTSRGGDGGDEAGGAVGAAVDAQWAEQEHALLLMKTILQAASASLRASQQALPVAASRIALRQRQQEQLDAMLASDRPLAGMPGRRLTLGGQEGARILFGSPGASSSLSSRHRDRGRDHRSLRRELLIDSSEGHAHRDHHQRHGGSSSSNAGAGFSGSAGAGSMAGFSHWGLYPAALDGLAGGALGGSGLSSAGVSLGVSSIPGVLLGGSSSLRERRSSSSSGGGSSGSRAGSSRRHHGHSHHERHHHRQRVGSSRRQRGVVLALPDPLAAIPTATAAASQPFGQTYHRQQQQLQADLVNSSNSAAARGNHLRQQQQQQPDRRVRQQQHMQRLHETLTRGITVHNSTREITAAAGTAAAAAAATMLGAVGAPASSAPAGASSHSYQQRGESNAAAAGGIGSISISSEDSGPDEFHSQSTGPSDTEEQQQQQHPHRSSQLHSEISVVQQDDALDVRTDGDSSGCDAHGHSCQSGHDDADAISLCSSLDAATCAICMDSRAALSVSSCSHTLCLQCAYQLCCKAKGVPLCPFCRQPIAGFDNAVEVAAP